MFLIIVKTQITLFWITNDRFQQSNKLIVIRNFAIILTFKFFDYLQSKINNLYKKKIRRNYQKNYSNNDYYESTIFRNHVCDKKSQTFFINFVNIFKQLINIQINNFQFEFKKYYNTLNVAKNNFDSFYFNINNTLTSSIVLIKRKYRLRFLSNVVRFLMLIFNTLIVTSIFFEQFIVDFSLFTQKISKFSNHLFVFDLFE